MTTNTHKTKSSKSTKSTKSTQSDPSVAPAGAAESNESTATPSNASTKAASPAVPVFQKAPPSDALIPTPPKGFVPPEEPMFVGTLPRLAELGALPGAITDLSGFEDYATVFGVTAPPLADVLAALVLCEQWSTMRKASSLWDLYAQLQEALAWVTVRPLMDGLRPVFAVAAAQNTSLSTKYSNLQTLLTAKQVIGRKGASTRAANKKAIAEGKPPIHGKAGKRRKKAADKAVVAAAAATQTTEPTSSVSNQGATNGAAPAANGANGTATHP